MTPILLFPGILTASTTSTRGSSSSPGTSPSRASASSSSCTGFSGWHTSPYQRFFRSADIAKPTPFSRRPCHIFLAAGFCQACGPWGAVNFPPPPCSPYPIYGLPFPPLSSPVDHGAVVQYICGRWAFPSPKLFYSPSEIGYFLAPPFPSPFRPSFPFPPS